MLLLRNYFLILMLCLSVASAKQVWPADEEQDGQRANPWELVLVAKDGALVVAPGLQKAQWKALPKAIAESAQWRGDFKIEEHCYVVTRDERGLLCAVLSFESENWLAWEDDSVKATWFYQNEQGVVTGQCVKDDVLYEWQASVKPDFTLSWKLTKEEKLDPSGNNIMSLGVGGGCGCMDEDWAEAGNFYEDGKECQVLRNRKDGAKFKITKWEGAPRHSQGEDLASFTFNGWDEGEGRKRFTAAALWTNPEGAREFLLNLAITSEDHKNHVHDLYRVTAGAETCEAFFPDIWKGRIVCASYLNRPLKK